MGLTDSENHLLGQIGVGLLRDDPGLARASSRRSRLPRARVLAVVLLVVSLGVEIVGAVNREPLMCALAWLGLTVGSFALVLTSDMSHRPNNDRVED